MVALRISNRQLVDLQLWLDGKSSLAVHEILVKPRRHVSWTHGLLCAILKLARGLSSGDGCELLQRYLARHYDAVDQAKHAYHVGGYVSKIAFPFLSSLLALALLLYELADLLKVSRNAVFVVWPLDNLEPIRENIYRHLHVAWEIKGDGYIGQVVHGLEHLVVRSEGLGLTTPSLRPLTMFLQKLPINQTILNKVLFEIGGCEHGAF